MSYTSDERDQAVQRIVQGNVSFTKDRLGPKDVGNSYAQLSELVNSALFYEPDNIFYLIYLSSNFYTRTVSAQITLIDELLDAVDDLLKPNKPINDVSSLAVARQALLGIDNALSRSGSVGEREYQRYSSAIDNARESIGRAVKLSHIPRGSVQQATEIVRPQAQAKSIAGSKFASVSEGHSSIVEAVEFLLTAYQAFLAAPLTGKIAQRQVLRAADELETLRSTMDPLSPSARVAKARDGLLTVLSNRAAVSALANRVTPGAAKVSETGSSEYRLTAYGSTGTAPSVTGTESAPWDLEFDDSDILNFDINGTAGIDVDLQLNSAGYVSGATRAELKSGREGPFRIYPDGDPLDLKTKDVVNGGTYAVSGKKLYITVDGNQLSVSFGSNRTATQLASDINTAIGGYVNASKVDNGGWDYVKIEWDNTTNPPDTYSARLMQVITSASDSANDLAPWEVITSPPHGGTASQISRGTDGNYEIKVQANDATTASTVTLTTGSWPNYSRTAAQVAGDISGTGFAATTDGDRVVIYTTGTVGTEAKLTIRSDGLRTGAPKLGYASVSMLGLQELGFGEGQEARRVGVSAQAVANILNTDTSFNAEATASVERSVLLKTNGATYNATDELIVYLPDFDSDPSADWDFTSVKMSITNGENRGDYKIGSTVWSSVAKTLRLVISGRTLRDTTATNRHHISVFQNFLKITSKDSSTSGSLKVNSVTDSAHTLIGLSTTEVLATVNEVLIEHNDSRFGWINADLRRKRIKVGDKILDGDANEIATVSSIVNAATGRLGVTDVAADLDLSAGFSIQSAAYRSYLDFEEALSSWQENTLPPYESSLDSIDQAMNSVLNVNSPSRSQVNTAYDAIDAWKTVLTELKTVFDNFSIPRIESMHEALDSLLEHGNDRARELLLRSRIEDYFGTTSRDASFSRALMSAASTVTVEDLNESTLQRSEGIDEFDRYAGGWMDEYDPAYQFENEDELPETPMASFWPGLEEEIG